jgi:hypothetical protein
MKSRSASSTTWIQSPSITPEDEIPPDRAIRPLFAKDAKKGGAPDNEAMTEKSNRARAIGMVIGIVVLVIALLWKRLSR